jgi:hypothetical protein
MEALGDLKPSPGTWAEYAVKSGQWSLRVRASVLPDPAPAGRYWLELVTTADNAPLQAVRLLVHGSPAQPGNLERVELYRAGQAPIEMPVDGLANEPLKQRKPPRLVRGREQSVQVPAGSFTARRFDAGDVRLWRSPAVPLWGLVKSKSPRQTVELVSSGLGGAQSVFPSPPQGNGSDKTK